MDRRVVVASLGMTLAVIAAGCAPPATEPPSPDAGYHQADGGSPTGGSQGRLKIGLMPKQKGIPYFNACQKGAEEAAAELGDIDLTYDGPTQDKSEDQSAILDTWTVQKFDAVAVACNDPDQIATSLSRARDAGIAAVTWDADANPETSKRQFFVNQVDAHEISVALVDEMAKQVGKSAQVAVVSSSSTAPNQSAWLKEMAAYMKDKYPGLSIVATEYAGENQKTSFEKAQNILKAHPEVKGIWGMTSVAFPGAAQAVEQAGKSGKVAVVGLGTPKDMREFVDRGVVKTVILWNPVDLGYLAVYVARATAKGELKAGATTFKAGRLGEKKVVGQVVMLGKPMLFDSQNIGQFDF